MQTDEFVANVNDLCAEIDPAVANDVCKITVRTLCEYLPKQKARQLSTQLPDTLGEAAAAAASEVGDRNAAGEAVSLEDFYEQLVARTEIDHATARKLVHAVAKTLQGALRHGEIQNIAAELPGELGSLFSASDSATA